MQAHQSVRKAISSMLGFWPRSGIWEDIDGIEWKSVQIPSKSSRSASGIALAGRKYVLEPQKTPGNIGNKFSEHGSTIKQSKPLRSEDLSHLQHFQIRLYDQTGRLL